MTTDHITAYADGKQAYEASRGKNVYRVADALQLALTYPNPIPWILGWLAAQAEHMAGGGD